MKAFVVELAMCLFFFGCMSVAIQSRVIRHDFHPIKKLAVVLEFDSSFEYAFDKYQQSFEKRLAPMQIESVFFKRVMSQTGLELKIERLDFTQKARDAGCQAMLRITSNGSDKSVTYGSAPSSNAIYFYKLVLLNLDEEAIWEGSLSIENPGYLTQPQTDEIVTQIFNKLITDRIKLN